MTKRKNKNKNRNYIPYVIAILMFISIFVIWFLIYHSNDTFTNTVTKLMENNPSVPTIELVEKPPEKNLIQKILGNVNNNKIPFKIKQNKQDYSIDIPSYQDFNFSGKGIVIAASGTRYRYLTGLYTNIYVIRNYHKSNIPIEIFYVGKTERFDPKIKDLIEDLGNVKIINLLDKIDTNAWESELRGYQTKPLACLCSSFEEIVLMDADALSFVDPFYFFDAEGYREFGMVLFKDYVDCMNFISKNFIETIGIGTENYCAKTKGFEIDSSCIIMNKFTCWEALYTICIINVKSDSYYKYKKNVLGDKDTWLIGSMFVNFDPFISRPNPSVIITEKGQQILGHLQKTNFIDPSGTNSAILYYNNQMIDLATADVSNWTYKEIKNPKTKSGISPGINLSAKVIETFQSAKQGMKKLQPFIPAKLKNKIKSYNGVSRGFIP